MSSTSHHGRPAMNNEAIRIERAENFAAEDPQNNSPLDPLTYYPVLTAIFSFLNDVDLKSCRLVRRYWRDVAAPMLPLQYEINLARDIDSPGCAPFKSFKVIEMGPYDRKSVSEYNMDFKRTNKNLGQVLLNNKKLAISLKVYCESVNIASENVNNFLLKYGAYVKKLILQDVGELSMSLNGFSNLLLKRLPNLDTLKCSSLQFVEDSPQGPEFDPALSHNKHNQLKRIFFEPLQRFPSQPRILRKILKMAPNLVEIHDLPLCLINEVEVAGKGSILKSVSYKNDTLRSFAENGLTVLSAFEKLALLQPQLTSWTFVPSSYQLEDGTSMEMIKPFVFSILQSSAQSLKSFEMGPTEWYGFQSLPQLEGLKTLAVTDAYTTSTFFWESKYFSPENSLPQIFTNVSKICICFHLSENSINRFLPENIISPWGSQIRSLQVGFLFPGSIPLLHRLFPVIQHLEFSTSEHGIGQVLPILAKCWSKLKTLTISVRSSGYSEVALDCALTGFSREVVTQLRNESTRENFTLRQIEGYKNQSTIGQLRELKQLRLELKLIYSWKSSNELTSLTHVTDEFGFKLIPDLKVTVGIRTPGSEGDVIKTPSLEPWAHLESSNVKVVDLYRSSGHC